MALSAPPWLLLIEQGDSLSSLVPELKRLMPSPSPRLVAVGPPNIAVPEVLSETVGVRSLESYRTPRENHRVAVEAAERILEQVVTVMVGDGQTVETAAAYKNLSLVRMAEYDLIYALLTPVLDRIHLFHRILSVEEPSRVILSQAGGPLTRCLEACCQARGVPVDYYRPGVKVRAGVWFRRYFVQRTPSYLERFYPIWIPRMLAPVLRDMKAALFRWMGRRVNRRVSAATPPLKSGQSLVLILTIGGRFTPPMLPVIRALNESPDMAPLVVDSKYSAAIEALKREGVPYKVFPGYADVAVSAVRRARARYRALWRRIAALSAWRERLTYKGVDLGSLTREAWGKVCCGLFPELIGVVESTRAMLSQERPSIVCVVDDRPPFQRTFIHAVRAAGLPVLGVQHSIFASLPQGGRLAFDRYCVDGPAVRELLVALGNDPESMVVTGQPRFDFLAHPAERPDRGAVARRLGLDPERRLVVLFCQAGQLLREEDHAALVRSTCSAVAGQEGVQLVIKLHPEEQDEGAHRALAREGGLQDVAIVKRFDLWDLLTVTDVAVVCYSTVGYEAIVTDVPLVQANLSPVEEDWLPYGQSGAALLARSHEELSEAITQALTDEETRARLAKGRARYVDAHAYRIDGRATERVVEEIRSLRTSPVSRSVDLAEAV
ncbi:CDP-glycerol glycerophosphotransferase family protein [Nitrospinae bacterium AH_259_B05_G02_I21]|nr:CDP-glycerol glycerophosphotransferase family protein [Nitrospinae bacterium AH_259_B05_G02_I21]